MYFFFSQIVAPAHILTWFTQWNIWNNESVFMNSPLKWRYFCLVFVSEFRDLKHWKLWKYDDQFHWIAVPFCRLSGLIVHQMSYRSASCPNLDPEKSNVLVETCPNNSWRVRRSRCNYHHSFSAQCHWTWTWLYVLPCQVLLDLPENGKCCKSCEICPHEFNWFSIKTRCVLLRRMSFEIFNLSCPICIGSFWIVSYFTQA